MNGIDLAPAAPTRPSAARAARPQAVDGDVAGFAAAMQSALAGDTGPAAHESAHRDTDAPPTDQVAAVTDGPGTTAAPSTPIAVPGAVAGLGTAAAQGAVAPSDVTVAPLPTTPTPMGAGTHATTALAAAPTGVTSMPAPTAGTSAGTTAVGVDQAPAMPAGTKAPDESADPAAGLLPFAMPTGRTTGGAAAPGGAVAGAAAAGQPSDALTRAAVPAHGHTATAATSGDTAAAATGMTGTVPTDTWMTPTTMTEITMTTTTTSPTTTASMTTAPTTATDASGAAPVATSSPQGVPVTPGASPTAGTHATAPAQVPAPVPVLVGPYALDQLGPVSGILAGRLRAGEGAHTLVVQVNPAALGPVRVSASLRNGSLSIELSGGADAARDALRSSLGDLVAALSGSGVDAVVTLNESRQADAGGARDGDRAFDLSRDSKDGSGRGADTGGRGRADTPGPSATGTAVPPARLPDPRPGAASRIDVRI